MAPILNNVSLADKTSFKIGGRALLYCEPGSVEDVVEACAAAAAQRVPVFVLGKGSNVLVSDEGFGGLVIDLSSWTGIRWTGNCAECTSGTLLHALVKASVDRGLLGLEKLAGIPGSVGGAVVMNAGAFGQCVSDRLTQVRFIDTASLSVQTVAAPTVKSSYRQTIFSSANTVVLDATFCFERDSAGQAGAAMEDVVAKRKARHPLDLPNCGSVFKNLLHTTAGTLIDQCGLKGAARGGAQVSHKHANFIVNRGGATAADVRSLIVLVQKTVHAKTGVILDPEVVFVGEFDQPLLRA